MQSNRHAAAVPSRRRVASTVVTAAVATVALSSAAHAQTVVSWIAGTGNYNTPANWNPAVTPSNAADQFLMVNNGGTALVAAGGEGAYLHLGLQPGDTGSLQVTGGTLTLGEFRVGGRQTIPDLANPGSTITNGGGTGSAVQTGGTVSVTYSTGTEPPIQSLYIANGGLDAGNSAVGSYSISNDAVLLSGLYYNDQISVGYGPGSRATFDQSGNSSVSSAGQVYVGRRGATATYNMSGGTLNTGTGTATGTTTNGGDLYIGDGTNDAAVSGTTGSFIQTGGSVTSRLDTVVGRERGTGFYSISGGSLSAEDLNVGSGGVGTFVQGNTTSQPNTTVSTQFSLTVGLTGSTTGTGSYTLNSGTLNIGNVLAVGNGVGSTGTFVQKAGTVSVSSDVTIGRNNSAAENNYDMQGGSLTVGRDLIVGGGNSAGVTITAASGTFTQTAGSVSVGRNLNVGLGPSGSAVTGVYNLKGGEVSLTAAGGVVAIGNGTGVTGTFNHTAGTLSVTGGTSVVDVGRVATNNSGLGVYNLSGTGVLNAAHLRSNGNTAGQINLDGGSSNIGRLSLGAGTMNITAGNHTITGAISLGSGSTLRSSLPSFSLPGAVTLGNATVQVDGGAALTFAGDFTVPSGGRTLTKTGDGTLVLGAGTWSYTVTTGNPNNNAVLAANAGTTVVNANLNGTTPENSMTVNVASGAAVSFTTNQSVRNVNASGTVTVTPGGDKTLNVTNDFSIPGGTVDLTNNTLTVAAATTSADTVRGYLLSAFNNGAWNGPGLTSSTARDRVDNATGLGWRTDGTTVTVLYTWAGDLNLDRTVDGDDFALIDRHVATSGLNAPATWGTGDVTYDGVVNTADYLLIDTSYAAAKGGVVAPAFLAMRQSQFGDAYVAQLLTAVPEPAALAAAGGVLVPLLSRHRKARQL